MLLRWSAWLPLVAFATAQLVDEGNNSLDATFGLDAGDSLALLCNRKTGVASDDPGDYGFMYLNLRMARGRSGATQQRAGEAVLAAVRARLDAVMATRHIGVTVQVDEGAEVFDAKHSTLHPLFKKP